MSPFERHSSDTIDNLQALWGIALNIEDPEEVLLAVPDGANSLSLTGMTHEQFFEFREAVNDLYDHIRQEQSTD